MTFTNTAALSASNPSLYPQTQAITLVTTTADATATINSADQTNTNCRGINVFSNVSAATGTSPTLTVTIQGKDPASGTYYTLLAGSAIAGVANQLLTVYPGGAASANVSANAALPSIWRVSCAIGGTTPAVTATVNAVVIP